MKLVDSDPVTIAVRPLPKAGELPGFTGGIGNFTIDPPALTTNRLRVGEPVRLTVTFASDCGTLHAPKLMLPSLATAQATIPFAEQSANAKRLAKQGYSLFRATPTGLMREFATDRPDKTESPYTVDAGRMQVELDMLTLSRDRVASAGIENTTTGFGLSPINIKFGLRHNVDIQFVVEPYVRERVSSRVLLEGPYNGVLMNDALRTLPSFPITDRPPRPIA